jgi:HlyD family secretion protein
VETDYDLQQVEFNAKEKLVKDKVIAPLEFNQDMSKLLAKKQSIQQMEAQLINSNLIENNKKAELLGLKKAVFDQEHLLSGLIQTLKSEVAAWMHKYIITSPADGMITFVRPWQENQIVGSDQEMFYLQSRQHKYHCEIVAGQQGIGKVQVGQKVSIRVDGYPSSEFGYLVGKVGYIADIPTIKDSFLIKVDLTHGLTTNYSKSLKFRNNLTGKSEIYTDSRKLIDRILGSFDQVISR